MLVFKDEKRGTWYVMAWYRDWTGERKQKCKRGFPTKREAQDWERSFQMQTAADMDMTFEAFVELYTKDVKPRLKENTWLTKENIIQKKILPYFGKRKISEITTKDVIAWQNELLAYRNEQRNPYSQTYLKTLHNQLSAIFNHAVRFYELRSNPAAKAGNMGTEERKEMLFWTKAEYQRFAEAMMDKPLSYYAFEMLYWCGIREGELLALTPADFDFEAGTVKISKSYQRLHGEDVITTPKTKKSNRTIKMPNFLCDEMRDYLGMLYGVKKKDRIFTVTKSYLHHEMDRGAKEAGVKRIRIHDLRRRIDRLMDSRETKRTVPVPSVGADGEQPISKTTTPSIAEEMTENNPQEKSLEERLLEMRRMTDPAYLPTISMNELYQNVYQSRPPIIDGLLYPGTYLFAGAPKVGKSFLMAQLAYHVRASPCGATPSTRAPSSIWRWRTTTAACRGGCIGCSAWTAPTTCSLRSTPNSSAWAWRNS